MATLSEELTMQVTINSVDDYVATVLKLFERHKTTPMVKPGQPVFVGDCYLPLSEGERRFVYQRTPHCVIELRPGVASKLAKAGIMFRVGKHDMLEKFVDGDRLVTFALP